MPNFGSGTLHPIIVPVGAGNAPTLTDWGPYPNCAVSLADYAKWVGYNEPAFWGVTYDGQELNDCVKLWTEQQRQSIARALAEAQDLMENVINFPLCRKWYIEQKPFQCNPLLTKWGKLIDVGQEVENVVSLNEVVSFATEPATIGPFATTVTNENELEVFILNTDRQVTPSRIVLSGGLCTIYIPRSRLVLPSDDNGLDWLGNAFTDMNNFSPAVDIFQRTTDPALQANIFKAGENCGYSADQTCLLVENREIGQVCFKYLPNVSSLCHSSKYALELYYSAGLTTSNPMISNAIIRLAHTLLPEHLCNNCDQVHRLWEKDTKIPTVLTAERINCPFGQSDGAWVAYKRALNIKLWRGAVL